MATRVKESEAAVEERPETPDSPLLDLSDDAVKKMIKAAKKRVGVGGTLTLLVLR